MRAKGPQDSWLQFKCSPNCLPVAEPVAATRRCGTRRCSMKFRGASAMFVAGQLLSYVEDLSLCLAELFALLPLGSSRSVGIDWRLPNTRRPGSVSPARLACLMSHGTPADRVRCPTALGRRQPVSTAIGCAAAATVLRQHAQAARRALGSTHQPPPGRRRRPPRVLGEPGPRHMSGRCRHAFRRELGLELPPQVRKVRRSSSGQPVIPDLRTRTSIR